MRRTGAIGEYVIVFEQPEHKIVHMACDGGRVTTTLVIVDTETGMPRVREKHVKKVLKGLMGWKDLLQEGLIECLDVNEENNTFIATYEKDIEHGKTTHLQIAPWTILGICAGLIPYPNRNQSPRNTYQCDMGKQAIVAIAYNQHMRTDNLLYLLSYTERPLVQTKQIPIVGFERLPGGQNASSMVMS
ncbi:DNA-directed RNA polymerase III subunit RPC2 [Gracilariopsis chorda]|uniref:DNA-directed RNA polymerase n=1 Tax=Gracilariopsis chorda TaxID=448386 RepID=A0A2V3IF34_9FLOR|nr:DNA-directed RNA polymerase III subunit RPC2 [Gracilariopsis chorda]|eukprot:PXF40628.1 DNA-directed RNA polymerase III subunit RPC2 [Gracilariopsis chorda]